jgi:hypothetical protein
VAIEKYLVTSLRASPTFPQYNSPNKIVLDSPISLSKFIRGVATAVPKYISPNTHMTGGSHRSIRENMAKKW